MLLGAEANAAEALEQQMLSRLDEQTLVGGKHVARRQLPDLPEHAETTVHRVKICLLDLADLLAGHPAWAWAMRGVESLGEPAVPVRFGAPAASVGADGQGPGVGALGGEDGQVAGVGAEAGTMLRRCWHTGWRPVPRRAGGRRSSSLRPRCCAGTANWWPKCRCLSY